MNNNTINELIDILDQERVVPKEMCRTLKRTHNFILNLTDKPKQITNERLMVENYFFADGKVTMPFNHVRVSRLNKDRFGFSHVYIFSTIEGLIQLLHFFEFMSELKGKSIGVQKIIMKEADLIEAITKDRDGMDAWNEIHILKPTFIPSTQENSSSEQGVERCVLNTRTFGEFLEIVNCPRHFITKVSPKSEGRSVEWVEAKSHYIVLDSNHNKRLIQNKTIAFNGEITRAMHNRRAHFRRLTSDKFKNKKGLTVWVRATWVGPTEWKDKFQNNYKIITK